MSKKKAFSGSTMTLKDFHGGSIPSDLSLPSAPGVAARPPDRLPSGHWAGAGRPDHHRPRPGSAGGRVIDDRPSSFFPPSANIGRHFDEDERKPFDAAAAAPRRPAADPLRPSPPAARRPISSPGTVGPTPNAWAPRKDEAPAPAPPAAISTLSGPAAATRFALASAIEKVSSGRWHSRPTPDAEVARSHQPEDLDHRLPVSSPMYPEPRERNSEDAEKARSSAYSGAKERSLTGFYRGAKESNSAGIYLEGVEQVRSPIHHPVAGFIPDGTRATFVDSRSDGHHQLPQQGTVDVPERPKLKLLPRTRPMESPEVLILDEKQGYEAAVDTVVPVDLGYEVHGSMNIAKPGSSGSDTGCRAVERPRLNLKPRSQPAEHSDEIAERRRNSVFGAARPRELVLKDRGIDNIDAENLDAPLSANRGKIESPKNTLKLEPAAAVGRHSEKAENYSPGEQRGGERKEYRGEAEKGDVQRSSWRKMEQRRPEADSWRKPIDPPKADAARVGKGASALELAHAFSRSVSDAKPVPPESRFTSLPGVRTQAPFSRLTDTRDFHSSGPTQRQINGY